MQFSIVAIALATAVAAIPSPDVLSLQGPNGDVNATVGDYNTDTQGGLQSRAAIPNCKGSYYCTNSQGFKNNCATASSELQPTTYTSGGDKAGTCNGHCGLFVQGNKDAKGNKCSASGTDLANAYQKILGNGCQTCGSVAAPVGGDCIITVNYVGSC